MIRARGEKGRGRRMIRREGREGKRARDDKEGGERREEG
jgi:hypothetical protein